MESIIVALITGGLALVGVIITVRQGNDKIMSELKSHQAVQDEKISNLTEEVRKHNSFAERIPVIGEKIDSLTGRVQKLEDEVNDLERSKT